MLYFYGEFSGSMWVWWGFSTLKILQFVLSLWLTLIQIYTENWVNSPGQQEDNSWQAFVFVPKDNWYIAKVSSSCFSTSYGNVAR